MTELTMEHAAGFLANELKDKASFTYGTRAWERYDLEDVRSHILFDEDLAERLAGIELMFGTAIEDPDKAVAAQIKMDQLWLDAIGEFAEKHKHVAYNWLKDQEMNDDK